MVVRFLRKERRLTVLQRLKFALLAEDAQCRVFRRHLILLPDRAEAEDRLGQFHDLAANAHAEAVRVGKRHESTESLFLRRRRLARQDGLEREDVVGVFQFIQPDEQHGVAKSEEHTGIALTLQARDQRGGEVQVAQLVQRAAVLAQHGRAVGVR